MLDDDLNAMLGDFGLARMSDHFKNPATTFVAGTYGFIAPEVSMTGKYTAKSMCYRLELFVFRLSVVERCMMSRLLCSHPKLDDRPTMHGVLEILARRVELPVVPRTKPEGDHYAYPYKNKERKLFLSDSGRRLSSVTCRTQYHLHAV
ncbi:hypothetical protein R1sor_026250 [Riccia sorocarpa]|uniref:Protein kinase domain-containing protein n=1 Tax=Riccia sorocarpa TaxID=122646 RepID=A0ABD3GCK5_9MARC